MSSRKEALANDWDGDLANPNNLGDYDNKGYIGSQNDLDSDTKPSNGVLDESSEVSVKTYRDIDLTEAEAEAMRCGLGDCKPSCLQVFNNPKAVLAWLCWFAFIQGFMCNGINNVNTSTMERRFELTSSQAGLISSSYDISAAALAIPVSYYGAHAHQPRMLTFAALIMAVGAFVMSVPHFGTGIYELQDSQADECVIGGFNTTDLCTDSGTNISMWLGVFILGMILNGIGGTALYTVGLVFLDTSVSSRSSPLYQAFLYSFATLGPAVGYLLGGYFVESLYVDLDKVDMSTLNVTPDDPRFVGAWWIGFLASGTLLFSVVLLLMCYPKELPATRKAKLKKTIECHQDGSNDIASSEGFGTRWRDMPTALKILLTNPVYMFLNLAGVTEGLIVSGIATFMPKFIQNQFGLTAGFAAMIGGALAVPGAAGGQFVGGLVCKLAKLKVRGMLRLAICSSAIAALLTFNFFSRCSAANMAGVNIQYGNTTLDIKKVDLESSCNSHCGCTSLSYEPVCGINGVQYFSPCHAGCQKMTINDTKVFVNCSCVEETQSSESTDYIMGVDGVCDVDCSLFYVFIPFFFLNIFFVFMAAVPSLSSTLRVIPESQRSFGVGIQWVFIRLLGSIPGPILMGYVFDTTCVVWQETLCGDDGSCWVYDNRLLSLRLFLMAFIIKIISTFSWTMAYILYKPPAQENTKLADSNGVKTISKSMDNVQENNGNITVPNGENKVEGFTNYGADLSNDSVDLGISAEINNTAL